MMVCANGTPIFRRTVESVRSLCSRETGSLAERCSKIALAIPKIAFGIFKINRVYFMRHGRRAYFSFFCFLFKIFHGNIGPDIPAKINQDIIDPFHAVKMCGQVIIVFDLRGELLAVQSKYRSTNSLAKFYPVNFGKAT